MSFGDLVEGGREEVAEIVGKGLALRHASGFAQELHHQIWKWESGRPSSAQKGTPGAIPLLFGELKQLAAKPVGQADGADFAFEDHFGPAPPCSLHGEEAEFRDPDASAQMVCSSSSRACPTPLALSRR